MLGELLHPFFHLAGEREHCPLLCEVSKHFREIMIECVSSLVIVSDRQMSAVTFQKKFMFDETSPIVRRDEMRSHANTRHHSTRKDANWRFKRSDAMQCASIHFAAP